MPAEHLASFDVRLYRAALHLCPGEFRREHGEEMAWDFDEARGEVASAGTRAAWMVRLLMGLDLARTIVVQWLFVRWRIGGRLETPRFGRGAEPA